MLYIISCILVYNVYAILINKKNIYNNMKQFMKSKGDNIYIIKDCVEESLCNELITFINNSSLYYDIEIKSSKNINVLNLEKMKRISNIGIKSQYIDKIISIIINSALNTFNSCHPWFKCKDDSGYFLKIEEKNKLLDIDYNDILYNNTKLYKKSLSIVIMLSENVEYIYNFPKQNVKFNLEKGDILLFPSNWTHPYEIFINNNKCYTINTWILEEI